MSAPILVCDRVEYGLDCFGKRPQTYRVTHHLRRVEDTLDEQLKKETDPHLKITLEICAKFREEDRRKRLKAGQKATRRYKLIYCTPDEATHVSLTGICGQRAPISECKRLGTVEWTPEHIARERANAVSDFWLSNSFFHDWEWE